MYPTTTIDIDAKEIRPTIFIYLPTINFKHGIFCELDLHSYVTRNPIYECIGHTICVYVVQKYPELETYRYNAILRYILPGR